MSKKKQPITMDQLEKHYRLGIIRDLYKANTLDVQAGKIDISQIPNHGAWYMYRKLGFRPICK